MAAPCTADVCRVGRVIFDGPKVPQLAVLEGTFDDPVRLERIIRFSRAQLVERGYLKARIAVTRGAGCPVDLHVRAELGPRYLGEPIARACRDCELAPCIASLYIADTRDNRVIEPRDLAHGVYRDAATTYTGYTCLP